MGRGFSISEFGRMLTLPASVRKVWSRGRWNIRPISPNLVLWSENLAKHATMRCGSAVHLPRLLTTESKKRPINSQRLASEFVIDEARLLEPMHEEANARPRGANHFCQRLMAYFRDGGFGRSMLIIMCEPQENTSQPFLTQIATLVN